MCREPAPRRRLDGHRNNPRDGKYQPEIETAEYLAGIYSIWAWNHPQSKNGMIVVTTVRRLASHLTSPSQRSKLSAVKCAISVILLTCFLSLGTGALQYLHNQQHAAEDSRQDAIVQAGGRPLPAHHRHDEGNCATHAVLYFAFFVVGWIRFIVCLGLLIAFLMLPESRQLARSLPVWIDCRGPPVSA